VVDRPAHGLGFDEPYVDLTVAAHSLRVIDTIYQWADEVGATRPESRLQVGVVLHSGQRIGLHDIDPRRLANLIRRDQPWVENFLPKIGEHERDLAPPAPAGLTYTALAAVEAPAATVTDVNLIDAEDELTMQGRTYAVIQVLDLAQAERLYHELLGLELEQRMRQDEDGTWVELGDDYDHFSASQDADEADIAFMRNGPLNVALAAAGRATRLDYATIHNQIAVTMEPAAAGRLRALVLMRGYTLLTAAGPAFSFRDPFGVIWSIHPHAA
jgi:catechol 2,3-dioxygenase-like lactoylglutathione lyase family enzyme